MVSNFKGLKALEEILARRTILRDNPNFGGNFSLRGSSVRGTTRLPGIFFLDFLLFFFYIVFLIVLYIYYISHLIYSLIILFSL